MANTFLPRLATHIAMISRGWGATADGRRALTRAHLTPTRTSPASLAGAGAGCIRLYLDHHDGAAGCRAQNLDRCPSRQCSPPSTMIGRGLHPLLPRPVPGPRPAPILSADRDGQGHRDHGAPPPGAHPRAPTQCARRLSPCGSGASPPSAGCWRDGAGAPSSSRQRRSFVGTESSRGANGGAGDPLVALVGRPCPMSSSSSSSGSPERTGAVSLQAGMRPVGATAPSKDHVVAQLAKMCPGASAAMWWPATPTRSASRSPPASTPGSTGWCPTCMTTGPQTRPPSKQDPDQGVRLTSRSEPGRPEQS